MSAKRPRMLAAGKHLRRALDRVIASSSLVPNDPVLDVRLFPWTQLLRDHWEEIRAEAMQVGLRGDGAQPAAIASDRRRTAPPKMWRSFFLWGYGSRIDENAARCPVTCAVAQQIPGLHNAFFSILAPGAHVPAHRGVSKGLITCHLALAVPRGGDARMRVDRRVVRWCEGETLVFDDTYHHEVWNETEGNRMVLLIQFERPLRNPGKWVADLFLGLADRSRFVQECRRNIVAGITAAKQMHV